MILSVQDVILEDVRTSERDRMTPPTPYDGDSLEEEEEEVNADRFNLSVGNRDTSGTDGAEGRSGADEELAEAARSGPGVVETQSVYLTLRPEAAATGGFQQLKIILAAHAREQQELDNYINAVGDQDRRFARLRCDLARRHDEISQEAARARLDLDAEEAAHRAAAATRRAELAVAREREAEEITKLESGVAPVAR